MAFERYRLQDIPVITNGMPRNLNVILIGRNNQDILDTINYHVKRDNIEGIPIRKKEFGDIYLFDTESVDNITVRESYPLSNPDQFVEAKVLPDATFAINASFYDEAVARAKSIDSLSRGSLYKWESGLSIAPTFYLPQDVMEAFRDYDWEQHESQVRLWLANRKYDLDRSDVLAKPLKIVLPNDEKPN